MLKLSLKGLAGLVAVYAAGFAFFLTLLPAHTDENVDVSSTDALVIFTGGSKRIASALDLVQNGYRKPVLISGVNPKVSREHLLQGLDLKKRMQVDVDYISLSTWDNAVATREWAVNNKVSNIGLITSYYHVPRSLIYLEKSGFQGDITLMPVFPEEMPIAFLLREYHKYVFARVRFI